MKTIFNFLFIKFSGVKKGKLIAILVFIAFPSSPVFCQHDLNRGHNADDMYFECSSNSESILWRLTNFGSKIQAQSKSGLYNIADPEEGIIIAKDWNNIYKSIDFGIHFTKISTPEFRIEWIIGGVIPGESIIYTHKEYGISTRVSIYRSTDYCSTFQLVDDSVASFTNAVIGHKSGEFYIYYPFYGHKYICHTLDFGLTHDTIQLDVAFLQLDEKVLFKIDRGANEGELFLVTETLQCPSHFSVYTSNDYGHNWKYKSTITFDCADEVKFSSGRNDCSFYIYNRSVYNSSDYDKIKIYYSSDCGSSFSRFEHSVVHNLGIYEYAGKNVLTISPNPASDHSTISCNLVKASMISIKVYNSLGTCVIRTTPEWQQPGEFVKTMDFKDIATGLYSVQILAGGETITTGKLIISR